MSQMVFKITEKGTGSREIGTLKWGSDEYKVVTGGYGKGPIPAGKYTIEVLKAVVGTEASMGAGFYNSATGRAWFLPLTPKFDTKRHGFGIHPDGNKPGTKGCVGLQAEDIKKFWDKWNRTSMKSRPTELSVQKAIVNTAQKK